MADELNVEVSAVGAAAEAHARMAYALAELKNHLTPDNTDYISIEQLEEMERMRECGGKYSGNGKYINCKTEKSKWNVSYIHGKMWTKHIYNHLEH